MSKRLAIYFSMFLFAAFLIAGCGGDGKTGHWNGYPDGTPPVDNVVPPPIDNEVVPPPIDNTIVPPPVDNVIVPPPGISGYGIFGGSAGMTNMGTQTHVINGDIGTIATATSSITGFHDGQDIFTETPANIGTVDGTINTCAVSTTGPTSTGVDAVKCADAEQGLADAQELYDSLVAMPVGANPGANLAGKTLAPGVYTAPAGSFLIEGGNLYLAGGPDDVWVFQMATTLTVGGPGAANPSSVILTGGAQAKNIFWQVGSAATINAGGGGLMVGTIISQAGATFSTAGNATPVTLEGRVLSLGASVTVVNTIINVPSQ